VQSPHFDVTYRYGNPAPEAFKKQMREIYEAYGSKYPLMITEFAVADWKAMKGSPEDNRFSKDQILKFMKAVLPWIEKQEWIAGYAWFPFSHDSPQGTSSALFDEDNRLTDLGRFYKSITTENPEGNQDI
jgi:Glycosyl hydrolase catalytic core